MKDKGQGEGKVREGKESGRGRIREGSGEREEEGKEGEVKEGEVKEGEEGKEGKRKGKKNFLTFASLIYSSLPGNGLCCSCCSLAFSFRFRRRSPRNLSEASRSRRSHPEPPSRYDVIMTKHDVREKRKKWNWP